MEREGNTIETIAHLCGNGLLLFERRATKKTKDKSSKFKGERRNVARKTGPLARQKVGYIFIPRVRPR